MRASWRIGMATVAAVAACRASATVGMPSTTTPPPLAPAPAAAVTLDAGPSAFVPRDVNHVLITGQSLAVGVSGAPVLTLEQPFHNLMFTTGVMAGGEG